MKSIITITFGAILLAACTPGEPQGELIEGDDLIVLEGATLIDGTNAPARPNAVVVIDGTEIVRIGTVGEFRYPASATVLDLSERYLIPGLIDVHAHIHTHITDNVRSETLGMLLAFGITAIRDPGAHITARAIETRDMVTRGDMLGPQMVTAGRVIDGLPGRPGKRITVTTTEEARAEVRRQYQAGVDLIKVYRNITPELLTAVIDEAHTLGIPVIGHLIKTSWTEAAHMGIDGLVHSGTAGPTWELIPLEALETLARARGVTPAELKEMLRDRDTFRAITGDPLEGWGERLAEMIDLNGPLVDNLITALVDNGVAVDPTLVMMQSLIFGDDLSVLKALEPHVAPKVVLDEFGKGWQERNPILNRAPYLTSLKGFFPFMKALVRRFHEEGVLLGAGSDINMPWIIPGVSFHRELELLVEAGISPADVLRIATRNGAQIFGAPDEVGTIEIGKRADIVVLTASPLDDIRNTRTIETVIMAGELFDPKMILHALGEER